VADGLPRPGEIAVRGEARREVEPERALVSLGVSGTGATASAALDDIAPRTAALDALLDLHHDGIANRVTASLVVGEVYEHDSRTGRRRLTGYQARRETSVVVTDLDGLGGLLRDAVDRAGARVSGPWWEVPPGHPVYTEVRTAAAADARERAEAYAAGLGVTVAGVEWVRDPAVGGGDGGGPRGAVRSMAMSAGAEAPAEALPVEVRAERVVVTAAVEVGFRLTSA
jgi:uncharacterized protein